MPRKKTGQDQIANILKSRNWTDWRHLRFKPLDEPEALTALANMAKMIKGTMQQLEAIIAASQSNTERKTDPALIDIAVRTQFVQPTVQTDSYSIPQARSKGAFNEDLFKKVQMNSYYVYTRKFDETIRAQELAEPGELMRLYRYLLKNSRAERGHSSLTQQLSGTISKSAKAISISISLLLDNSGSMRGGKMARLAGSALYLTEWLERWQIRTEVLGFTTRAWKGGQSRELWLADGKPESPGRLNDLRHVIYKSFDKSMQLASPGFEIMAREGLLKENIDGEALLWAHGRLSHEKSHTKVICMFTDGPAKDDSTLSVNHENFLIDHFKDVVQQIADEDKVLLRLIGIDCDLSTLSADAVTVTDGRYAVPVFNILRTIIK